MYVLVNAFNTQPGSLKLCLSLHFLLVQIDHGIRGFGNQSYEGQLQTSSLAFTEARVWKTPQPFEYLKGYLKEEQIGFIYSKLQNHNQCIDVKRGWILMQREKDLCNSQSCLAFYSHVHSFSLCCAHTRRDADLVLKNVHCRTETRCDCK